MTLDEFSRCIALVDAYWPHGTRAWTPEALQAWESLLLDLEAVHVAAAIQALAADGREWPPPPGAVRRRCLDLVSGLPSGDEAWGEIVEQIRKVGILRGQTITSNGRSWTAQLEWSHPLIGEVADHLGWAELCASENQVADRAHFLRMWSDACQKRRTLEQLPPAAREALAARGIALPDLRSARAIGGRT